MDRPEKETGVCPECGRETEFRITQRIHTYHVKDRPVTITENVKVCLSCDEDVYDQEIDTVNLRVAYAQYNFIKGVVDK